MVVAPCCCFIHWQFHFYYFHSLFLHHQNLIRSNQVFEFLYLLIRTCIFRTVVGWCFQVVKMCHLSGCQQTSNPCSFHLHEQDLRTFINVFSVSLPRDTNCNLPVQGETNQMSPHQVRHNDLLDVVPEAKLKEILRSQERGSYTSAFSVHFFFFFTHRLKMLTLEPSYRYLHQLLKTWRPGWIESVNFGLRYLWCQSVKHKGLLLQ